MKIQNVLKIIKQSSRIHQLKIEFIIYVMHYIISFQLKTRIVSLQSLTNSSIASVLLLVQL